MNFENMNQAIVFVQMLQKIYTNVRIMDADSKEVLYNSGDSQFELTLNKTTEQQGLQGSTASYTDCKGGVISISGSGTAVIITTVPISINSRFCHLELVQHAIQHSDASKSEFAPNVKQDTAFYQIRELIITDSLTQLYNRRYIDEQLPLELTRSFEKGEPLSFIYADIDHFKKVNDQYGHVAGDHVLKKIADIIRRQIRSKDGWVARYGGEEFLICLSEINQKTAVKIANRIRREIENCHPYAGSQTLRVTCSFGVQTVYKESNIHTVDEIVALVDKKLYEAKKNGRNRVIG